MNNITYKTLNFCLPEDVSEFKEFYYRIYLQELNDNNTMDTIDNFFEEAENKNFKFYVVLAFYNNKVIGGLIADIFSKIKSAVIEYIIVAKEYRKIYIGKELVNTFFDDCKKNFIKYCFLEIEKYNGQEEKKIKYLFWNSFFAKLINVKYIQPPLDQNKKMSENLNLALISLDDKENKNTMNSDVVNLCLKEYFKNCFCLKEINKFLYTEEKTTEFKLEEITEYLKRYDEKNEK